MLYLLTLIAVLPSGDAPNRCGQAYAVASADLGVSDRHIRRRRYGAANTTLDAAIDRLGDVSTTVTSPDHTALNLLHAGSLAERGRLEAAAHAKRRILATRLDRCTRPRVTP